MYADRLEAASTEKRSIRERLNGNVVNDSIRRRQVTGKRQRQDDKWEHDLYEDEPEISARKLGARDLRLKLQKKTSQLVSQTGSVRDLREKLSGSMHPQPVNNDPPKQKPVPEAVKPSRKSVIVEAPATTAEMISKSSLRKKTQQKADVEGFLQSLGLEKYLITFQAEEVDMTALEHMTDEDLKAMGIPMGPRKKILLALNSKG